MKHTRKNKKVKWSPSKAISSRFGNKLVNEKFYSVYHPFDNKADEVLERRKNHTSMDEGYIITIVNSQTNSDGSERTTVRMGDGTLYEIRKGPKLRDAGLVWAPYRQIVTSTSINGHVYRTARQKALCVYLRMYKISTKTITKYL